MTYLKEFFLPKRIDEDTFLLNFPHQLEMQCYSHTNSYPFRLFPEKGLSSLDFGQITVIYGGNGSGKSTLLNVIGEKIRIDREARFNKSALFDDYVELCGADIIGTGIPRGSRLISSDDVFDFLLDMRSINEGINARRNELFLEYESLKDKQGFTLRTMEDYEELKRVNEARASTKSEFTSRRLRVVETASASNGESAYQYFTRKIDENALYLLDEPENSLSPLLQAKLAQYIADSARFYGCQFIISSHSPYFLSLASAVVYDLDKKPAQKTKWTELENIRMLRDFFKKHENEF